MSYREENGQVILTMSRDDFERWAKSAFFDSYSLERMSRKPEFYRNWKTQHAWEGWKAAVERVNRLNEGNPNYMPYQVEPDVRKP